MTDLTLPELLPAAGTLAITSITVDGAPVNLDGVVADVTIRHGRSGFFDSANPSTCQLTLLGVASSFSRAFRLGSRLVVNATDGASVAARFTGRFTDATLVEDELTAIAVGAYRTLSGYTVGTVDWPEEKWSARVTRAFAAAGLAPAPIHYGSGMWATSGAGTSLGHSDGPPAYTFWNLPAGLATWSYCRTLTLFPIVKGRRYRVSSPQIGGHAVDYLVALTDAGNLDGGSGSAPLPGTVVASWAPWSWEFTANATGDAGIIFYSQSVPTEASYLAIQPLTVECLAGGLALQVGPFDPLLIARPAEPVTLAAYLDDLATMVQSAVADLPDGRILVQAIGARTTAGAYALDPDEVVYTPEWTQRLPGGNIVTVSYGSADLSVVAQDAGSTALYGPIAADIATTFKLSTDADQAAQNRLARDAYSHWTIQDAPLLAGRRFTIGQALVLAGMPAGSPYDPWGPILEGWTDSIRSDGHELQWTMELALSDPLLSGLAMAWNAVPAGELWNTVDPALLWRDALTVSDL